MLLDFVKERTKGDRQIIPRLIAFYLRLMISIKVTLLAFK